MRKTRQADLEIEPPPRPAETAMVCVNELTIDEEAQRKVSMKWVMDHVDNFDADQLGRILVNIRDDGRKVVVDGWHRTMLMREVGWGDQKIEAEIFRGLSLQAEARLFLGRNARRAVRLFDRFRVSATARDADTLAIVAEVQRTGLTISDQARNGNIVAITALQRIYAGGGIADKTAGRLALRHTLETLVAAWGRTEGAVTRPVLEGIGLVFLRYGGGIEKGDLVKKLASYKGGSPGLWGKAKTLREMKGVTEPRAVAEIVVELYNRGRRVNKLESWDSAPVNMAARRRYLAATHDDDLETRARS